MNKNKNIIYILLFSLLYLLLSLWVTTTLKTNITKDNSLKSLLEIENIINKDFGIKYNNIDINDEFPRRVGEDFGMIGVASLSNEYLYGYNKHQSEYISIKVIPFEGDGWYMYLKKDNEEIDINLEFKKEVIDALDDGDCLVYVIGNVDTNLYAEGQKNIASIVGIKLISKNINNKGGF